VLSGHFDTLYQHIILPKYLSSNPINRTQISIKMAPSQLPMQNINRRELYTSLAARVEYLHAFLDFSSRDIEALISGSKYIKQLIPAVVNIVYKKLLQYDITARAFTTRSTSYEGPIDGIVDEDSPQIKHRKMFLTAYLNKICSDPSKFEFWEYLDKVGYVPLFF
jgi:hypothetical protein